DENKVPKDAMEDRYIKSTELNALFMALSEITEISTVNELNSVVFVDVATIPELQAANNVESLIFRAQLSKAMLDTRTTLVIDDDLIENDTKVEMITQEELRKFFITTNALGDVNTIQDVLDIFEDEETDFEAIYPGVLEIPDEDRSDIILDTVLYK